MDGLAWIFVVAYGVAGLATNISNDCNVPSHLSLVLDGSLRTLARNPKGGAGKATSKVQHAGAVWKRGVS